MGGQFLACPHVGSGHVTCLASRPLPCQRGWLGVRGEETTATRGSDAYDVDGVREGWAQKGAQRF